MTQKVTTGYCASTDSDLPSLQAGLHPERRQHCVPPWWCNLDWLEDVTRREKVGEALTFVEFGQRQIGRMLWKRRTKARKVSSTQSEVEGCDIVLGVSEERQTRTQKGRSQLESWKEGKNGNKILKGLCGRETGERGKDRQT